MTQMLTLCRLASIEYNLGQHRCKSASNQCMRQAQQDCHRRDTTNAIDAVLVDWIQG